MGLCVPGEYRISGELLGKVLGSPILERDGLNGESPAKGCQADGGFGASVLGGKAGGAGLVQAAHVSPVLVRQVEA